MVDEKNIPEDLKDTVVRICPACGVVNPAGPSDTCPHLQLARFDGLDQSLSELLQEVAEARSVFATVSSKLKEKVKLSIRNREAEIETTQKIDPNEQEQILNRRPQSPPALSLESPPTPKNKPRKIRKKRQRSPLTVNPKQLDLIAREPAKGDA